MNSHYKKVFRESFEKMKDVLENGGDYDAALHELEAILDDYEDKFYNYMTGEDTLYNIISSDIHILEEKDETEEPLIECVNGTIGLLSEC